MRKLGIVLTIAVLVLAACVPTGDEGPRTKDEGQRTNDERRTTVVATTVTPVPTLTATPLPTATATPTITPTPTRTLTPAEARATRLPAFANLTWRAEGDSVKLYDAKNKEVAVFDPKTFSLRWDSQKHFGILETYLKDSATPQDRAVLVKWMKALKEQGVHFITFPDSQGRKEIPPYIVIPTADGKDIKMIPAKKGTADFVYDAKAEKILSVFPDGSGYYFVNPDGSFDLKPLEAQTKAIAQSLRNRGVIQHPDPAKADFIQQATAEAILINPYGVTPKEINDFIKARTGRDFAEHFNRTWGYKVGVTFEEVMAATLAKSPSELFAHLHYIGQSTDPLCQNATCWAIRSGKSYIFIVEQDISARAYYPLPITLVKEAYGSKSRNEARQRAIAAGKLNEISQESRGAHIGGAISFAIQAYTLNQHPEISPHANNLINESIDSAFRGGPPGWIPGQPY